ncbi:MAG: hypothetical protein Q8S33_21125 [Myxococcales bacterium]|nr:hypothetical protein [Myxococcales bacterium]
MATIRQMADDLRANPAAWENRDLHSFLEAAASWLEDSDGYYRNIGKTPPATPSWSTLGEILQAARSYE